MRPTLDRVDLRDAVAQLPVRVTLSAPIIFRHGDRAVLARRVVPSIELLRLHRAVHQAVPPGEDAAHTVPGSWTPHVTLARRVRMDVVPDALRLVGRDHSGVGFALRRWDSATAEVTQIN